MRVSKGLAILLVLGTIALTASTLVTFRNLSPRMDLSMRYNESFSCATNLSYKIFGWDVGSLWIVIPLTVVGSLFISIVMTYVVRVCRLQWIIGG